MKKKTILITGASQGIGKETALLFQQRGWNVAATMRQPGKSTLPGFFSPALDVTKPETITAAVAATIDKFGEIDVLLNNAGYGAVGPFEAASREQILRQYETNLFGLMEVTRAVLPHFRQKKNGLIINVTSIAGRTTFPLYTLYNSTKWAVEGFSEALRFELDPLGIKVKVIEPAAIKTEFSHTSADICSDPKLTDYDNYIVRIKPWIEDMYKKAHSPREAAAVIYRAASDNSGKFRYVVGLEGRLLLFMRRLLPDNWIFAFSKKLFVK
ncbi:MAG: SDR family oxidoreductase [Candidatus Margulisbacteria bacterium]|nr:SDR family oxidoreductase [Candidatus Margulisiibacteriota bacterium]